jgi:hypothetical protein
MQLERFNYDTLGDLVKGLIAGKITQLTRSTDRNYEDKPPNKWTTYRSFRQAVRFLQTN